MNTVNLELCNKGIEIAKEAVEKASDLGKRKLAQGDIISIKMICSNLNVFFINAINASDAQLETENIIAGLDNIYLLQHLFKNLGIGYNPVVEIFPHLIKFISLLIPQINNDMNIPDHIIVLKLPTVGKIENIIASIFGKEVNKSECSKQR